VLCGCHLTRHNPNSVMGKLSSSIYFNIPTVTLNIEMNYSISKLIETKFANKTVCMLEILFYIKKLGFVWCSNFEAPFLTRARRTVLYYCMCCGVCDVMFLLSFVLSTCLIYIDLVITFRFLIIFGTWLGWIVPLLRHFERL